MDLEIIEFEKSLETRVQEYAEIFSYHECYEINDDFKMAWFPYVSSMIELTGWAALWKPPKSYCFQYNVRFSSTICVTVQNVDYESLSAEVQLDVERNKKSYTLPQQSFSVPLVDLYFTEEQNSGASFTKVVAECLDQLRLFYKYLWWPWDAEEECTSTKWLSQNLEPRLKLYYNILEGKYSELVIKTIKTLIEKGTHVYEEYMKLFGPDTNDDELEDSVKYQALDYLKPLEIIKLKLKRFTNSDELELINLSIVRGQTTPGAYIISPEPEIDKLAECTDLIAKHHPTLKLKQIVKYLEIISCKYNNYNVIFLERGDHLFISECLNVNVTIKTLFHQKAIIRRGDSFWYLLKTTADNVTLENVVVEVEGDRVGIYVKEGITYLNSVIMKNISTQQSKAIIVENKATLIANKCQFHDFNVGITCLPGSAVQLIDCSFEGNNISIEVGYDAQLCMSKIECSRSGKAFIRYEGNDQRKEFNSLDTLSRCEAISFESVKVDDEEKAVEFV